MQANFSPVYSSVKELAGELGLAQGNVYKALHAGVIPSIRIGSRFVIPRAAVQKWLETAGGQSLVKSPEVT